MDSRRDFLKKAALLAAGGGLASIEKALAIDPAPGSTWLDAEHVVILMQENRSFDHCYGALRGVRGFDDPRAVSLPNGNPVWLQSNKQGDTYAPFRLNLHDTKATWMSSIPHSWVDQTDARNNGHHDGWLDAKRSGNRAYADLPLTLGHYDRSDIPFYYALADAFTVCDQNFCSSLTGTTPNRLYLWSGTVREKPSLWSKANIRNEDVDYGNEASWTTFPERLEELGVSWRIYQNEISLDSGFRGEEDAWLSNFTDNPIEWFKQYHVRYSESHRRHLAEREKSLPGEIAVLEAQPKSPDTDKKLAKARGELEAVRRERATYTEESFAKLPAREQALHRKAFTTNSGDPHYRELAELRYQDGATERQMQVPRGDVLHQFRDDVRTGKLPAVSWIVAPENFSDHPGAPWYGAWYLSECLDILTKNPEVWRKTIFVLCYDENDGYFDHVPPFVPPPPDRTDAGKVSAGIDVSVEHVPIEQEQERQKTHPGAAMRSGPIGLGFRVPLVIASPWSRGGYVNSQVFDHTSILQMLERLLSHKTGRPVRETNISAWRRTVCGDLSSVFRPYRGEKIDLPKPVERDAFLGSIHQAQFKELPNAFRKLSADDLAAAKANTATLSWLPKQEPGTRPACALPYELAVDGALRDGGRRFELSFTAGNKLFGARAAGSPFRVTAFTRNGQALRHYAVAAGDTLKDSWSTADFTDSLYRLEVHGPNGFFRAFQGSADEPAVDIEVMGGPTKASVLPNVAVEFTNLDTVRTVELEIVEKHYGKFTKRLLLKPNVGAAPEPSSAIELSTSAGWYEFEVKVVGSPKFLRRFAGHIETGAESTSDPLMGRKLG